MKLNSSKTTKFWRRIFPLAIFLSITVAFHLREIFFAQAYLFSDRMSTIADFSEAYGSRSLLSILQWTESVYFGFSWIRGGISFHFPEVLLMRIFEPFYGILLSTLFGLLIAQIFSYLFLRLFGASQPASIIGAVMFAFSGSIIRQYVHYEAVIVMVTTPLLFWLFESLARRLRPFLAVAATLVIANNLFVSHLQAVSYQLPIVAIYYGVRVLQLHGFKKGWRHCFVLVGILAFSVMLAAPHLLPFQDQIAGSVTAQGRGNVYSIIDNALLGWRSSRLWLLFHSLFAPGAVGSDVPHASVPTLVYHSWIWSVYLGVLPWFCVSGLWGLRRRIELLPLVGVAAFGLWLFVPNLLLPILPDLRSIYAHIPIWNMFHYFERGLFLGVFSVSVLLALSLDSWASTPHRFNMLIPLLLLGILGGLSISSSLFYYFPQWLPQTLRYLFTELTRRSGGNYIINTKIGSAMSVFVVFSFALVFARARFGLPRSVFLGLGLILLVSDLFWFGLPLKATVDIKRFLSPPKLAQAMAPGERFIRVTSRKCWVLDSAVTPFETRRSLGPNMNFFFGLSEAGGYTLPVLSKEEYSLFNLMLAEVPLQGPYHKNKVSDATQFAKVLDLWRLYSIEYLVTDMEVALPGLSLVEEDGQYRLYKIKHSLPRFFCVSSVDVVDDWDALIDWLSEVRNKASPGAVILNQGLEKDRQLSGGKISSISGDTTKITAEVEAGQKGTFLVQTDRWTKQWRAAVDGKPTKLYRVNGMQRGVFVPAGNHTVRLQYYDRQLMIGLGLAGFSLLVIGVLSVWLLIYVIFSKSSYTFL